MEEGMEDRATGMAAGAMIITVVAVAVAVALESASEIDRAIVIIAVALDRDRATAARADTLVIDLRVAEIRASVAPAVRVAATALVSADATRDRRRAVATDPATADETAETDRLAEIDRRRNERVLIKQLLQRPHPLLRQAPLHQRLRRSNARSFVLLLPHPLRLCCIPFGLMSSFFRRDPLFELSFKPALFTLTSAVPSPLPPLVVAPSIHPLLPFLLSLGLSPSLVVLQSSSLRASRQPLHAHTAGDRHSAAIQPSRRRCPRIVDLRAWPALRTSASS